MKLLFENENVKVYAKLSNGWEPSALVYEVDGKLSVLTADPGELEPLHGQFLINRELMPENELKVANSILAEVAQVDSMQKIDGRSVELFSLKDKYLCKLQK